MDPQINSDSNDKSTTFKTNKKFRFGSRGASKKLALLAVGLVVLIGSILLIRSYATTPGRMYLTPATGSQSGSFSTQVRLDTSNESVNVVRATVTYPSNKLQFIGMDSAGTAFSVATPSDNTSNGTTGGNGVINISKGQPSPVTGDVLMVTLNFKVISGVTGSAAINITSGDAFRSKDNSNLVGTLAGATYTLVIPPATPGRFYLTPSSGNQTTDFSVQVKLDTAALSVNSLETKISYPADKLDFVGNDDTGSVFTSPFPGNGVASNGIITISKGDPNGRSGTGLLVSTLKFRPKAGATGAAALSYTFGEALEVGSGANIVGTRDGASYTVQSADNPPVFTAFTASPSTVTAGTAVQLSTSVTDDKGISKVEFLRSGGAVFATDTAAPYTATFNTTGLAVGTYELNARATDTGGHVVLDSVSIMVTASTTDKPPTITAFTANPISVQQGNSSTLTVTAKDDVGIPKVEFSRNGTVFATDTAAPFTTVFNTTNLPVGSYLLTAKAYDTINQTATATLTLIVTPKPQGLIGDLNGDGLVDEIDVSIMYSNWTKGSSIANLNNDGTVDEIDLSILYSHWKPV